MAFFIQNKTSSLICTSLLLLFATIKYSSTTTTASPSLGFERGAMVGD